MDFIISKSSAADLLYVGTGDIQFFGYVTGGTDNFIGYKQNIGYNGNFSHSIFINERRKQTMYATEMIVKLQGKFRSIKSFI